MQTTMKNSILTTCLFLVALPLAAVAQTTVTTPGAIDVVRRVGEHEITLGGSGGSNTSFDSSFGGLNFSYGTYFNPTLLGQLRQSVNYSNPDIGGTQWNGSTKLAVQQHLTARGRVRPFVGVNFGRVYGDAVQDTWAAGLEAGAKFYVQSHTFVYVMAEYGWFFERARRIDNSFGDGQLNFGVGIGYNF